MSKISSNFVKHVRKIISTTGLINTEHLRSFIMIDENTLDIGNGKYYFHILQYEYINAYIAYEVIGILSKDKNKENVQKSNVKNLLKFYYYPDNIFDDIDTLSIFTIKNNEYILYEDFETDFRLNKLICRQIQWLYYEDIDLINLSLDEYPTLLIDQFNKSKPHSLNGLANVDKVNKDLNSFYINGKCITDEVIKWAKENNINIKCDRFGNFVDSNTEILFKFKFA